MSESHVREAAHFKIKFRDVFHLRNLYIMMHEYLMEEYWFDLGQDNHDYIETLYLEKFNQKGLHFGGKEMWIYWRLYKMESEKKSSFFRFLMNIDWRLAYLKDVEVMHQGKKITVQQGELELYITSKIELDFKMEWRKHWLLKHFLYLYENRIFAHEFHKRQKILWRETYRLQGMIKKYLNLRTFIPTPEPYFPPVYGWGAE